MALTVYDYIIFSSILIVSALIGVYYRFTGGKQKTIHEYLLASRQMSSIPVAFSLMASFMSAVTLLGVSSDNYVYGTQFQIINISYVIGTPIITHVFLPVFYSLKVTSVYEYLEKRFGKAARLTASIAFSLQMFLYMGIVLYAPSLALSAVTGIDKILAILSVGMVCTFYSSIGGLKAVLITDVFQSILMFVACYCVIIHGVVDYGLDGILERANDGGRIEFFNMELDPTVRNTFWSQMIGGMFIYLSIYAVNQAQVQRLCSVRTLKESQRSLWISLPILNLLSFSTALAGLTVYARYKDCDPIKAEKICSVDQLLPYYVAENLSNLKGISGLFIGGILSGSLSTVSSIINSLAAVTWSDYIEPVFGKDKIAPVRVALINKILAIFYGFACIGMAFVAGNFNGVLQASLTIFGIVGGPLLGLFTLGMVFPYASEKPCILAFLLSLCLGFWMGFGGPRPPVKKLETFIGGCTSFGEGSCSTKTNFNETETTTVFTEKQDEDYFYLYRISYMWYTLIGFSVTVLIGAILSIRFPEKRTISQDLLSPILSRIQKYKHSNMNGEAPTICRMEVQNIISGEKDNISMNSNNSENEIPISIEDKIVINYVL